MDDELLSCRDRHPLPQVSQARYGHRRNFGNLSRLSRFQGLHLTLRPDLDQGNGESARVNHRRIKRDVSEEIENQQMTTNSSQRQAPKRERGVIRWLLDSDPSIRWQTMRDLTDAPADEVAAERARVAIEGAGARLLALQAPDGRWGGAAWNRGWDSTMHVLSLLREMGLDPASNEARRAVGLVRGRVTWRGCGPPEC